MNIAFFLNSILLGVGLAMDAFSVSCANGLREPRMKASRMALIAGVYAGFQFLMPVIGWVCVHTVEEYFTAFQDFIPWIAMVLLLWIGGKMILEGIREERVRSKPENSIDTGAKAEGGESSLNSGDRDVCPKYGDSVVCSGTGEQHANEPGHAEPVSLSTLMVQGIATSIDALSVGFTIAGYDLTMALTACLIIAVVTYAICTGGLVIGRKVGERLAGKAGILGGVILIFIGIEIVVTHYFLP